MEKTGELRFEIMTKTNSTHPCTTFARNGIFIPISYNAINELDKNEPKLGHAHQKGRKGETHGHHQQTQKIGLVQIRSYGSP